MICPICLGLRSETREWKRAWSTGASVHDLYESSQGGCVGCTIIYEAARASKVPLRNVSEVTVDRTLSSIRLVFWDNRAASMIPISITCLFTKIDSPWTAIPVQKTESAWKPYTLNSTVPLIKKWLAGCKEYHSLCKNSSKTLPTRLLDVSDRARMPTLISSHDLLSNDPERDFRYVALSHRWGSPDTNFKKLKTTGHKLKEYSSTGIPMDQFPETFHDAIQTVRALDLNYIWIDSICIVQDSVDDWSFEAGRMSDVYRNAYLTFAADHAANSSGGLYLRGQAGGPETRFFDITDSKPENRTYRIFLQHPPRYTPEKKRCYTSEIISELEDRAWVLQEQMLSRRIIYFTNTELLWRCKQDSHCQCGLLIHDRLPLKKLLDEALYQATSISSADDEARWNENKALLIDLWRKTVRGISGMKLTVLSDRLPALSGLARCLTELRPQYGLRTDTYLAGIWLNDFDTGFLWHTRLPISELSVPDGPGAEAELKNLEQLVRNTPGNDHRVKDVYVPSWSYASVSSSVDFESRITPLWSIQRFSCTPSTANMFGNLSAGWVQIEGSLIRARIEKRIFRRIVGTGPSYMAVLWYIARITAWKTDLNAVVQMDAGIGSLEVCEGGEAYFLLIAGKLRDSVAALLLEELSMVNVRTFRRVGFVEFSHTFPPDRWSEGDERIFDECYRVGVRIV